MSDYVFFLHCHTVLNMFSNQTDKESSHPTEQFKAILLVKLLNATKIGPIEKTGHKTGRLGWQHIVSKKEKSTGGGKSIQVPEPLERWKSPLTVQDIQGSLEEGKCLLNADPPSHPDTFHTKEDFQETTSNHNSKHLMHHQSKQEGGVKMRVLTEETH